MCQNQPETFVFLSLLQPGSKKMEHKGSSWHENCFTCNRCQQPIGTRSFVQKDSSNYCLPCYEKQYAQKCCYCKMVRGQTVQVDQPRSETVPVQVPRGLTVGGQQKLMWNLSGWLLLLTAGHSDQLLWLKSANSRKEPVGLRPSELGGKPGSLKLASSESLLE